MADVQAAAVKPVSRRRCGCPEQYHGRYCAACHGTGVIPAAAHRPFDLCPDSCTVWWLAIEQAEALAARLARVLCAAQTFVSVGDWSPGARARIAVLIQDVMLADLHVQALLKGEEPATSR